MNRFVWLVSIILILTFRVGTPETSGASVLTYHNDNARTGQNSEETILTLANVNSDSFGKLFDYKVDGYVYAQPLLVSGVDVPGQGIHNLLIIATEHDSVYAFDADSNAGPNAQPLWMTSFLGSGVTSFSSGDAHCSAIVPEIGITGTPVIDPYGGTLYLVAKTSEIISNTTTSVQRLHALDVATGQERPSSPVVIQGSVAGTGDGNDGHGRVPFQSDTQLQRAALLLDHGVVYVAFGSHCDNPPYHGWIFGYNASSLSRVSVYCSTPNGQGGGVWLAGGGPAADVNGNVFVVTGNGGFDASKNLSCSFLKLSRSSLAVSDFFTPFNQAYLNTHDLDISGGTVVLPDEAGSALHPHLVVAGDKQGAAYLVDRDKLGKYNSATDSQIVQELTYPIIGGAYDTPAYFNKTLYWLGAHSTLTAFPIANGKIAAESATYGPTKFGYPGATPSISANGTADAIVWVIQSDAFSSKGPAILRAYNATNVSQELYNSSLSPPDRAGPAVKFSVPTVANGKVYVAGQGQVSIYGNIPPHHNGTYRGLFRNDSGVALESSGSFTITTTIKGKFTGKVQSGSGRYSISGSLDQTGGGTALISRRNQAPLYLQFQLGPGAQISGTVSDGNFAAALSGERSVFDGRTSLAPQAGRYTLTIPGDATGGGSPAGHSYGTVSVTKSGQVVFSGALSDGTRFNQASTVAQTGKWPVYVPLYSGHGALVSWLAFSDRADSDLAGQVNWIKSTGAKSRYYPDGFEVAAGVVGSRFVKPGKSAPVIDPSAADILELTGGDDPTVQIADQILLGANNRVTDLNGNKLSLTFDLAGGSFKGSIANPDTLRRLSFNGVVLQKQNRGAGFFLGTTQSGAVSLSSGN
jgi:hypothetical protein